MSERCERTSERAKGRAIGPVLTSLFMAAWNRRGNDLVGKAREGGEGGREGRGLVEGWGSSRYDVPFGH